MPTLVGKEQEMMRYGKSLLTVAAAAVVCLASQAAMAAPVSFTTQGTFTGPNAAGNVVNVGGFIVSYNSATVIGQNPPTNVDFGTFTVAAAATGSGTFSNGFNFVITQMVPLPGGTTATKTGTLTGTLTATASSVVLNFTNSLVGSVDAGGFLTTYFIKSAYETVPNSGIYASGLTLSPGANNSFDGSITQTTSSVPLPPAAVAGVALLGSLGMTRVRRRFNTASA